MENLVVKNLNGNYLINCNHQMVCCRFIVGFNFVDLTNFPLKDLYGDMDGFLGFFLESSFGQGEVET